MAEENLIKTPDMGEVQAKDFVEHFSTNLAKLRQAFGITRDQPMTQGNTIQLYKFTTTKPSGGYKVGEGELIPNTHVTRVKDRSYTVDFSKARKTVTIEEVQRVGYDMAVLQSDKEVLKQIHKDIRADFFTFLGTNPKDIGEQAGLQMAAAKAIGELNVLFDNEDNRVVLFINPLDAATYLGAADITNGVSVGFGLTLLSGFMGGIDLFMNASVPKGTFFATVRDNINLMHIDTNGESRKLFYNKNVTTDELGLIAMVKDDNPSNLTNESVLYWGIKLFAEVTNGVLKGTFKAQTVASTSSGGAA